MFTNYSYFKSHEIPLKSHELIVKKKSLQKSMDFHYDPSTKMRKFHRKSIQGTILAQATAVQNAKRIQTIVTL